MKDRNGQDVKVGDWVKVNNGFADVGATIEDISNDEDGEFCQVRPDYPNGSMFFDEDEIELLPARVVSPVEQPGSELERLRAENAAFRASVDYENSPAPVLCGTCFAPAQCVRPGKHQCDWCEQRERLERENGELRAIVSSLPTSADGVPVVPGMKIWQNLYSLRTPVPCKVTAVQSNGDFEFTDLRPDWSDIPLAGPTTHFFSTEAAALAARPAPATSGEGGGK